jgi:hypothetical protein
MDPSLPISSDALKSILYYLSHGEIESYMGAVEDVEDVSLLENDNMFWFNWLSYRVPGLEYVAGEPSYWYHRAANYDEYLRIIAGDKAYDMGMLQDFDSESNHNVGVWMNLLSQHWDFTVDQEEVYLVPKPEYQNLEEFSYSSANAYVYKYIYDLELPKPDPDVEWLRDLLAYKMGSSDDNERLNQFIVGFFELFDPDVLKRFEPVVMENVNAIFDPGRLLAHLSWANRPDLLNRLTLSYSITPNDYRNALVMVLNEPQEWTSETLVKSSPIITYLTRNYIQLLLTIPGYPAEHINAACGQIVPV